jgi:hypothetical protein
MNKTTDHILLTISDENDYINPDNPEIEQRRNLKAMMGEWKKDLKQHKEFTNETALIFRSYSDAKHIRLYVRFESELYH